MQVGGRPRAADDVDLGLADGWVEGADASLEPLQQAAHRLVLGLHVFREPLDVAVGARRGALGYDLVGIASRDSGEAVPELLHVIFQSVAGSLDSPQLSFGQPRTDLGCRVVSVNLGAALGVGDHVPGDREAAVLLEELEGLRLLLASAYICSTGHAPFDMRPELELLAHVAWWTAFALYLRVLTR